jgi:hypothetical protein
VIESVPSETVNERGEYLRTTLVAVAARLVGQMLDELAGASTATPSSLQDRLLMSTLRPWIPKLRDTLLHKLSETDPASMEQLMGATATALESILAQAPGEPLPRYRIDWDDAGTLVLVPLELV